MSLLRLTELQMNEIQVWGLRFWIVTLPGHRIRIFAALSQVHDQASAWAAACGYEGPIKAKPERGDW